MKMAYNLKCLNLIFICCFVPVFSRSFTVDYKNDCFLKDGKPFRYVSGSIHYFRVPHELWYDRIYKMKMAGLNAIQTYVEWSSHEPEPGVYNFESQNDLPKFLQIANDLGMVVILRTGPFIDAERDMGGFPYWLLRIDPNMKFRSYNTKYMKYIDRWYKVLLPVIEPYLYNNGGPIIMVQIENEYGSTRICDAHYKSHLRNYFLKYLKHNVVLFTTDGSDTTALTCGKTDEVLSTFDFGTGANVSSLLDMLRWHQASGPLVNSEYYPGWLDHWGQPHANVTTEAVVKTLTDMLQANASVNIYMFHGGTSFGFSAGSNGDSNSFQACPTSYDYDAPLSEAGDPTPKYYAIREAVGKFLPLPAGPVPTPAPKMETDPITLKKISLWDYIAATSGVIHSPYPISFEDIYHPYGYVMYRTVINVTTNDPAVLTVKDIGDRGYVYIKKVLQGILSREQKIYSIPIRAMKGDAIEIIVENQGRICFGSAINDRKGIFQNVTLDSHVLLNWEILPIKLDQDSLKKLWNIVPNYTDPLSPAFYIGSFVLPNGPVSDTFLRVDGWHKGVAILNTFNLGRYWPIVGPQVTLYAPKVFFQKAPSFNEIVLLELEHAPCDTMQTCNVRFVKEHVVNGTTPASVARPNFYGTKFLRG